MDATLDVVNSPKKLIEIQSQEEVLVPPAGKGRKETMVSPPEQKQQQQQQQQQLQQKTKRKHRRGKPKSKNANKLYKKSNWRFQMPRLNYSKCGSVGGSGGCTRREKLQRSRSLVPYNTNKFLMEEHLAEVPSSLLTPTGRTRDSSFSMDSEDNYFFSLPEDEEEFLTKEFANVYEKARVERLESLSKQELIEECLQIEDRYSKDQGNQRQQQLHVQRIAQDYMARIKVLDEKVKELSQENHILRCQLMRSAALAAAAAASPPSATTPIGAACQPTPMDSSSEDSESDSSSTSSSSSSSSSSNNERHQVRRRRSYSSHSSLSEYNGYIENNYIHNNLSEERDDVAGLMNNNVPLAGIIDAAVIQNQNEADFERRQLLDDHMDDEDDIDGNDEYGETRPKQNVFHTLEAEQQQEGQNHQPSTNLSPIVNRAPDENNTAFQNVIVVNNENDGNNEALVVGVENLQNPSIL